MNHTVSIGGGCFRFPLFLMIIARSPLRISLGGGSTDLPSYYEHHTVGTGGGCFRFPLSAFRFSL